MDLLSIVAEHRAASLDRVGQAAIWRVDVAPETRLADLKSSLTQVKLDPVEFAPLLAPLLDISAATIGAPELPPDELRRRQLAAMVAWLLAAPRLSRSCSPSKTSTGRTRPRSIY